MIRIDARHRGTNANGFALRGDGLHAARALFSLVVCAAASVGCGSIPNASSEGVASTQSELVTGAMNVSRGLYPTTASNAESQTASVGMGKVVAVAHMLFTGTIGPGNNEDEQDQRCRGISQVALSYFSGPGTTPVWRGLVFPVPLGIGSIRMDPSISYFENTSSYTVSVSAVAFSTAYWNSQIGGDSCVSYKPYALWLPDQVCVMSVTIPKSGAAAAAPPTPKCVSAAPGGNYNDTALTTIWRTVAGVPTPATYLAVWDRATAGGTVDFFDVSSTPPQKLATPFINSTQPVKPSAIARGPIFVKGDPTSLIAPDTNGDFWLTSYSVTSGTWGSPVRMSPKPSGFVPTGVALPFHMFGYREYAAVYVPNSYGPGMTELFYGKSTSIGQSLVGYALTAGGQPGVSNLFNSEVGHNSFRPAVEVVTIPALPGGRPSYASLLTYWDDGGQNAETQGPNGILALKYSWAGGAPQMSAAGEQTPCVVGSVTGYWGYNDEMAVQNNNTATPTFWRFFVDSTDGTCVADDDFDHGTGPSTTPQHVSALLLPMAKLTQ
jgi:hypothetical protein